MKSLVRDLHSQVVSTQNGCVRLMYSNIIVGCAPCNICMHVPRNIENGVKSSKMHIICNEISSFIFHLRVSIALFLDAIFSSTSGMAATESPC